MFKKMLIGVALGSVAVGAGATAFERLAPSPWVAPLAAMGEHGDRAKSDKAARRAHRDRQETRHDRRHDDR